MVPTGIQAGAGAGPLAGHGPLPAAAGENNEKIIRYQMAEMCGLSVRRYQELEQGHSLPLLSTAVRMAAVFDLSLDSLKSEVR